MAVTGQKPHILFRLLLFALYASALLLAGYVVWNYWDYYMQPFQLRPRHPDYRVMKPGGFISHGLGILGTLMMLLLLLYSVRKRTRLFGRAGAVSRWLDVHIFLGSMGPVFVVLHSTFKLNGLVAVSFWSMVLVALSGVLGRYLYLQIPRGIRGNELTLDDVEKENRELAGILREEYHLNEDEIQKLEQAIMPPRYSQSMFALFFGLLFSELRLWFRLPAIRRQIRRRHNVPAQDVHRFVKIVHRKAVLARRIALLDRVRLLFHYWHVFHKPFAIIMYLIMLVHVGISVYLGYTWIF